MTDRGAGPVRVVVEKPAGPYNRYEVDRRGGIALAEVVSDACAQYFEAGYLDGAFDQGGRRIGAIVPVRNPTFLGCSVAIRAIGLAEPLRDDDAYTVVGVPTADRYFNVVQDLDELPEPWAGAVSAVLSGRRMMDGHRARSFVAAAREETLRARAAIRSGSSVAAWKTGGPLGASPSSPRQSGTHTMAERAVPLLPLRFQEYIARELLDDERILMFVHRPTFALARSRLALRGRRLPEGILVITDRQVMFMVDVLDPGGGFVHWGYVAQVSAVERLASAAVTDDRAAATLQIRLQGRSTTETLNVAFPDGARSALEEAAALLSGFVAPPDGHSVRRVNATPSLPDDSPPGWAVQEATAMRPLGWAETRAGDRLVIDGRAVSVRMRGG